MKGKSRSHRYRPASEYDDATLAQKREYWRNKKREQRARRSERAGVQRGDSCGNISDPPTVNSLCTDDPSRKISNVYALRQKEIKVEDLTEEVGEVQNEKWFENSPQVPSSCFISATVSASARVPESGTFASLTTNRTQLYNSSLVPAVRNGRVRNGSSSRIKPQPCVSMQQMSVSESQKAQDALQAKQTVNSCTTLNFSQCGSNAVKTRDKTVPQIGTKSLLGRTQRSRCVVNSQSLLVSEEEKAARRREQWRIKKREQRAKLAARLGKTTLKTQRTDVNSGGRAAQNSALNENRLPSHLPPKTFFNGVGQKQWNRVKTVAKRENQKLQIGCSFGQQMGRSPTHAAVPTSCRGRARCKTPRHRHNEAQKVVNPRNARGKLSLVSGFGSRNVPKIDPNDSLEQIIAKRREYWRIKKREQRAKMSMEAKARLAERDSFMRRVKRYQSILEEIRRSRNLSHISESPLTSASETIGGFIKEDGTMTFNISQSSEFLSEEKQCGVSKNTTVSQPPPDTKWRTATPISEKPASQSPRLPRVKISVPLSGALAPKPSGLLSIKPVDPIKSPTVQAAGQPSLTHPLQMHSSLVTGPTAESDHGGCVMKMAVSSSVPSLSRVLFDPNLTEEERMAKKREYWRVKKREQRAARAARLKLGVFHARVNSTIQRRKASRQIAVNTGLLNRSELANSHSRKGTAELHVGKIKQETESVAADIIDPCPDQVIHSLMEPSNSALPAVEPPQIEVNPAQAAESQITTLQAVASMKKLLEETLSTVTDRQSVQTEIKTEAVEDIPEEDTKPKLSELIPEQDSPEMTSDLKLHIKADASEPEVSSSPLCNELSQKTPPPLASDEAPPSTCDHDAQTSPNVIVSLCKVEAVQDPASHIRNLRLRPRITQHAQPSQQAMSQQQLSQLKLCKQQKGQNWAMQKLSLKQSGRTSLQEKREYWKLMKRQQRARLRARQREAQIDVQDPALEAFDHSGDDPLFKPSNDEWTAKIPGVDSPLPLPTLIPPDNPLSSMDLHPIEPLWPSAVSGLSPVKLSHSPENISPLPTEMAPLNNLVPPKRIPGEPEEDFMKRKREYWRIKKKEQRARKANRIQAVTAGTTSNKWRPIPAAQDLLTQRALAVTSEQADKDSQQLTSESFGAAQGSFTFCDNTAAASAPSEPDHHEDEDFISVALWRNCYLMDYDPLNQLLVCMVCGELQYSHSLEGVKAHIDQAHPQTMELEVLDRQRLLDAWDKQLSQRERFFTSQLQQKSAAVADADSN
ncbi:uncharacterized protein si:dkey-28a3.2 isoform X1 [Synchiropus splendidus]|uniref:uncharacterized protein si:dkey-28a3.2 isoform X1 n=1 Tax=Synchiropus splendidus TaxID=270530 RepID=UPI00237E30C6|nr:uncharacterized protein si:dkey-28a3.2 isoform X1 [Synchiropus splendidus]XP_053715689.1 uncharacterized protein si:dkey-28a3.2 isoform X1 [Synchiropus splendidus]